LAGSLLKFSVCPFISTFTVLLHYDQRDT
jgi:hypothetical protein